MKAITPLISVILLLLITIAIVGFTYTWFTRFSEDVTEELSNETEVSGSRAVRIEALSLQTVTLKNIGTKAVPVEDIQIYVNDIPTTCDFTVNSILPGQIATCTNLIEPCTFGSSVRITTPSGFDVYTCPVSTGSTSTTSSTTTTTTISPSSAYLSAVLDLPVEGSSNNIQQNNTFIVRVNVTCVGGSCGNVNGTLRYNSSGTEPNTAVSTNPPLATIQFDANSSAVEAIDTSLAWSHTIGVGNNRILVVGVTIRPSYYVTGVTYGGFSLTKLADVSLDTYARGEMWFLVNPPTGTNDVSISVSGDTPIIGGATSWNGVNQASPFGTVFNNTGSGSFCPLIPSSCPTVTVSSASGEVVIDVLSIDENNVVVTEGAGQTLRWNRAPFDKRGAGSSQPGASYVTISLTPSNPSI